MEGVCEGESTTLAAPPHTRQDAEADFLGGLTGGGDALSHSQNAMEFCSTRHPSTCRGGGGGGGRRGGMTGPHRNQAAQTDKSRWEKTETKKTEGGVHMKDEKKKKDNSATEKQKRDAMGQTEK